MNKLIFFYLLALMTLYINAGETEETGDETGGKTAEVIKCEEIKTPAGADDCKTATDVKKDQECQFVAKDGETAAKCKLVTKATNSSNVLNIFKITFALLIIFTIL